MTDIMMHSPSTLSQQPERFTLRWERGLAASCNPAKPTLAHLIPLCPRPYRFRSTLLARLS